MDEQNLPPLPDLPTPSNLAGGVPKATAEGLTRVREHVSSFAARVRLVEDQLNNIRGHLELIDSSMVDKHKTIVKELRSLEDNGRELRAEMAKLNDLVERTIKRLESLSSKEEVKVLERYIEMWQPMNYITRDELKSLVQKIIKEQTKKGE